MKHSTKLKAGAAAIAGSAVAVSSASALTSTFTVSVAFFDPFSITEDAAPNFGELISEVATTYSMASDGTITPGAGGSQTGDCATACTPSNGQYDIQDSSSGQPIDITVDNQTAVGGVTIDAFNCSYNGGAATQTAVASCTLTNVTNPGAGINLLLGFDITVDGTQTSGNTALPTFDITVAYN